MPPITRRDALAMLAVGASAPASRAQPAADRLQSWPLATPRPTGIHDVAPAPDGGVWFTAQRSGHLGWFDPKTGRAELVALGARSSPHGVIQGPDKAAWITDGGQGAIVRVGWPDREVRVFALPEGPTPTSTRRASTSTATSGSPGRAAWWAGWR